MATKVKQRAGKAKAEDKSPEQPIHDEKDTKKKPKKGDDSQPALAGDKFGPLGLKKNDQLWSRAVLMTGVLVIVIVTKLRKSDVVTWAGKSETLTKGKYQPLICSDAYMQELNQFPGCAIKQCGRFVVDGLFDEAQVDALLNIFQKGLKHGGSSGGVSVLDLHSGALSKGEKFINVFSTPEGRDLWTASELAAYTEAKDKVKAAILEHFKLEPGSIHLASPTFFSEMTDRPAKTVHDEYWHPHVDKETYETFHFTSLLYLSDYGQEFQGGRFIFKDGDKLNRTVEPRRGRVSMFTSGGENVHYVERVTSGRRYALTIAFTCDARHGIANPSVIAT